MYTHKCAYFILHFDYNILMWVRCIMLQLNTIFDKTDGKILILIDI